MASPDSSRSTLETAASMRVLAHPTRLRLLGLLRERGPQTAALLGDEVDEAPGTVSYHLSKLASIGLIEPAAGRGSDRRERWWQAAAPLTSWEPAELLHDPDRFMASSALQKSVAQVLAARFSDYLDASPTMPPEWVAAGSIGDRALRLTVGELAAMRAELEALTERWAGVSAAHDAHDANGAETDTANTDTANAAADTNAGPAELVTLVYQAYRRP